MKPTREAGEARHPIRVVAARTGLTPDVLRAWERRYGAVTPMRTEGGQRLYTDADVHRLRLLAQASAAGRQIGLIAEMPAAELAALVAEDERVAADGSGAEASWPAGGALDGRAVVGEAMAAVRELDGARLRSLLHQSVLSMGVGAFVTEVVFPLLHQIGDAWHEGQLTPAHEHMASAVIRDALAQLISEPVARGQTAPLLVVATLADERHEFGAMAAAAAATGAGWRVLYLGADLPGAWIASAAKEAGARAVAVGVVQRSTPARKRESEVVELISGVGPWMDVFVGGPAAGALQLTVPGGRVHVIEDLGEFVSRLRELRAQGGAL